MLVRHALACVPVLIASVCVFQEAAVPPAPVMRIIQLNSPEWLIIIIGCVAALAMGCVQPAFAILFSNMLGVSVLCIR